MFIFNRTITQSLNDDIEFYKTLINAFSTMDRSNLSDKYIREYLSKIDIMIDNIPKKMHKVLCWLDLRNQTEFFSLSLECVKDDWDYQYPSYRYDVSSSKKVIILNKIIDNIISDLNNKILESQLKIVQIKHLENLKSNAELIDFNVKVGEILGNLRVEADQLAKKFDISTNDLAKNFRNVGKLIRE